MGTDEWRTNVTDVDFEVERGGQFLRIEWKRPDQPIPQGQRIHLEALSRKSGFTVLVVWGAGNYPWHYQEVRRGSWLGVKSTSREDFQKRVDQWFAHADACARELAQLR